LIYHAESGAIRMLLAGDAMPSRRLTPFDEPDYLALVNLLRSADIAFVNLETTVRNRDEGVPAGRRARR
jgi:poly-gamma-glutamate synthesis protein (capsule biosynthesis protein)